MSPKFLKIALILSLLAFGSSFMPLLFFLLGWKTVGSLIVLENLLGIIPLFTVAAFIMQKRTRGKSTLDIYPILFIGLPKWFRVAFRLYGVTFGIVAVVLVYLTFQTGKLFLGLLFIFAPSLFYAVCIGVFWSEMKLHAIVNAELAESSETMTPRSS